MSDIPEAILSKAREIYESSWPDPVRAIAEALMEASQQWQPIETAPKDGTIIDVWVNDPDGPFRQTNAIWNDGYWVLRRNMWSSIESFFDEKGVPKIKITHWMPLPKPPEGPVDITDIAQAAHPIIDAGNALIQHLKGKSA
jgi:hypothetical protein